MKKQIFIFKPMTSCQALIAGASLLSFFVIWFFLEFSGNDFIEWIGGKNNLSGWAQFFGVLIALAVSIYLSGSPSREAKKHQCFR